ncbi:MAG: DUF2147 domain-containing protein [Flavobacteriales bacterium]|nr:DUF2147 domain-containing protein [Flavobacteriales bacterium]
MVRIAIVGLVLLHACSFGLLAQNPDAILGKWMDEEHETIIEIYKKNSMFYGRIVWLKDSLDPTFGGKLRDVLNDDVKLRSRKVLGIDMLEGFVWDGVDAWRKGRIYYYQTGNDYNGKIYMEDGELKLKGYYSILFFLGRTKIWSPLSNASSYGLK